MADVVLGSGAGRQVDSVAQLGEVLVQWLSDSNQLAQLRARTPDAVRRLKEDVMAPILKPLLDRVTALDAGENVSTEPVVPTGSLLLTVTPEEKRFVNEPKWRLALRTSDGMLVGELSAFGAVEDEAYAQINKDLTPQAKNNPPAPERAKNDPPKRPGNKLVN